MVQQEKMTNAQIMMRGMLYFLIVILLALLIDYSGKILAALGSTNLLAFYRANIWFEDLVTYVPIYLFMLFYLKATFNPLASYGYTWKKDKLGLAVIIGIISGFVMYGIDWWLNPQTMEVFTPLVGLGYLVASSLLPALVEETLFRGVIQSFYQKVTQSKVAIGKWNVPVAVFIASGFEMLFHIVPRIYFATGASLGGDLVGVATQVVYVLVFGAIGGYLYFETGSLAAPIIIHALGNLTEYGLLWMIH